MKQDELIPNNWYYWNDPDDGLTSQPVKYLEMGIEPGVVDVAGEIGNVFSVLLEELSPAADEGTMPLYNRDLSKLAFSPMYWFKSVYNMRISETGFVLIDVKDRDPLDPHNFVETTIMFDIKTTTRLEFIKRRFVLGSSEVEGTMRPAEDTIFIEHNGGSLYLTPGTNVAHHLFNVLNQLRMYFAGFMVSLEDLEFVESVPEKSALEHLENVLIATIRDKSSCPFSKSHHAVDIYVTDVLNRLAKVCPGWSGEVKLHHDNFHYAKFTHRGDDGTVFFDLRHPKAKGTFLRFEETVANEPRG